METIAEDFVTKEEKIRKQIKAFIKSRGSQITQSKTDAWLSWIEKQGEPNPYSGVSFKYNGHTWKPSDAQMNALWDSIKHNLQLHPVLKSLYNDLKKLREDKI